jgi:hypothetical protein
MLALQVFKVPAKMEKLHIAEVLPGVWIGDRFAAADRALLDARHISMIVNCAAAPPPPPGEDAKWVEMAIKLGFVVPCFWADEALEGAPTIEYLPIPVKDEVGVVDILRLLFQKHYLSRNSDVVRA